MMEKNLAQKTIKNSIYNASAGIIAKIGSLALTILLARMLMPELFGIYSLVLSIVLIVFTFTDLGINSAVYRYLSFALKNNDVKKARSYLRYLLKIKWVLLLLAIILMFVLAPVLSYNIYNKPIIFLPLLFATIYIFVNAFRSFFEGLYFPTKDLSKYPLTTFILHGLRFILSLIVLLIISRENAVTAIFVAFAAASFLALISVFIALGKRRRLIFGKVTAKIPRSALKKYIGFMSIASISLIVFGSIDILMLGYFVDAEYLGYYRAALGLVVSFVAVFSLSNIFLPIFTQIEKQRLNRAFEKAFRYISLISIPAALGLILIGKYVIKIIYGMEYIVAALPLYILSFLMVILPLQKLYSSLFESKEKTKVIAVFTIISLAINILLNYILIKMFLSIGQEMAIFGAGLATLVSKIFYLSFLSTKAKPEFKIKMPLKYFTKPLFAGIVMVLVLLLYNLFVEMNIFTGILEVLLGVIIYFLVMFSIKGIIREDLDIMGNLFRRN